MVIPESKFDDWDSTGADHGSKAAADRIERMLNEDRSPVEQADCSFVVRRQGSYKNDTHTYGSSDVDVIAKLTSCWNSDTSDLTPSQQEDYDRDHTTPDYGYLSFREDVWNWIKTKFDQEWLLWDKKAIEISSESPRVNINVDLVPCIEHRKYHDYSGLDDYDVTKGMAFSPRSSNEDIINFPSLHYQNGCDKHDNYKETVRIFKNARDYYNDHYSTTLSIGAHSYGIECLIYNVPETILKRASRSDRFEETLEYLNNTPWDEFDQVSKMEPLFGPSNTQWQISEAEELINRLSGMWESWNESKSNAQLLN